MTKAVRKIAKELVDLYEERSLRFDERREMEAVDREEVTDDRN